MPSLRKVVVSLSTRVKATDGRFYNVMFHKPPAPGGKYDAEFLPRHLLLVPPTQPIPFGTVLFDLSGNRFFCMPWSEETYRGKLVNLQYVLFEVNRDAVWKRPRTAVEPISGLGQPGADQILGTVPIAIDAYRRKEDPLHVEQEIYKSMSMAAVQVGDFLDAKRVRRIEVNNGITYAQLL